MVDQIVTYMGASFPFFSVPYPLTYVKPVLEDQQPKKIENITQSSLMYSETEQSLLSSTRGRRTPGVWAETEQRTQH